MVNENVLPELDLAVLRCISDKGALRLLRRQIVRYQNPSLFAESRRPRRFGRLEFGQRKTSCTALEIGENKYGANITRLRAQDTGHCSNVITLDNVRLIVLAALQYCHRRTPTMTIIIIIQTAPKQIFDTRVQSTN